MVVAPPTPLPGGLNDLLVARGLTGDAGVEEFLRAEPPRNHFGMIYCQRSRTPKK